MAATTSLPAASSPRPDDTAGYGRGARILGAGIGLTGLLTASYFAVASHVLGPVAAKRVDVLWSIAWVIISVIYRPIEQLLSRSIAERRAHGDEQHSLRTPLLLQGAFAAVFLIFALLAKGRLVDHAFDGSSGLYWILVAAVLLYAASYFARGWLAGHKRFGLYGGLVLMESAARLMFALGVAVGIVSGQVAVALGIAVAPLLSLVVVPAAFARRRSRAKPAATPPVAAGASASARRSAGFALGVAAIMISEQTILNAGVLSVDATARDAVLAGIVFNVMLIARAPLQLFQAIQTSLLPHLTTLTEYGDEAGVRNAVRTTILIIAALGAAVVLGLATVGPFVMSHVFGQHYSYGRFGLAAVGLGMAFHLAAGTLNQAALARGREGAAAAAWALAAALFLAWTLAPIVNDGLLRVEVGYPMATGGLAVALFILHRRAHTSRSTARTLSGSG
jgi:O-antigen/teichoic acid export membrane protein